MQKMQHPWVKMITAAAITATLLAGCGQSKQADKRAAEGSAVSPPVVSTAPQVKKADIQAYFGDSNGNKLVQQTVSIAYAADRDKYLAALNALKTAPDTKLVTLCAGIDFKSAEEKSGILTVNLTIQKGGQLGSGGEVLLLQSLQQTMFQYPELSAIDILVDGNKVDSLMGHMDLPHPIKRAG